MPCPEGLNYAKGCRCDFCRAAKAEAQRVYRLRTAKRRWGQKLDEDQVDAAPAIQRIRSARRHGATIAELAKMTGLHYNYVQALDHSRPSRSQPKRIMRSNYVKIMTGIPEFDSRAFLPTTLVPRTKALQICHSLSAQGWTVAHQMDIVEKNTPHSGQFIGHLVESGRKTLLKQNEDIMLWLERNVGNLVGPSKKSQTLMRNRGHFPTKHYNPAGRLMWNTLSKEQKAILERVQSTHD